MQRAETPVQHRPVGLALGVAGLMLGLATVCGDNLATIIRDGMLAVLLLFGAVLWEVHK